MKQIIDWFREKDIRILETALREEPRWIVSSLGQVSKLLSLDKAIEEAFKLI